MTVGEFKNALKGFGDNLEINLIEIDDAIKAEKDLLIFENDEGALVAVKS